MLKREAILEKLQKTLDPERFEHSLRAEKVALALAKKYRINRQKASLAALLHDCARRYSRKDLLEQALKLGLAVDATRRLEPKLFHGEIGEKIARAEFGVRDIEVLRAIRNHTTGAPGMSKLEKAIYLADHVEEGRYFPGVEKLRKLAFKNMDLAIYESTCSMIRFLLGKNLPIYAATIQTRNYFLTKI